MSRILVIGESCLDKWLYVDCVRIAPDLPVPVVTPNHESENPGMAANVKRNIEALGEKCDILTNDNWREVSKTRIVHEASNHTFLRIDSNDKVNPINLDIHKLRKYDIIIISDYNKNFLTEGDIKRICHYHDNVFLDTKKVLGEWAEEALFIKINSHEYHSSLPYLTEELKSKLIWTDGANGANYKGKNFPTKKIEVKDGSGCGDSFLASLVTHYLNHFNIEEAINFANECATKVAGERGVTVI